VKINLPEVDWQRHEWTIPGQIKKVLEEAGEVAEAIANQDDINIIKEALDTAQTCFTLISMVQARSQINLDRLMWEHTWKLNQKGYLREA
jgi:NTP pyrophosphatase (non-canonical NTP hydrolase)